MQDGSNGIKGAPVINAMDDDEVDAGGASQQAGVQSVEIAARILKALAADGRPLPLKGVAKVAGMSRAKVHRYLVSLKRAGLVSQEARSGDYRIGPTAVTLGLVGLRSMSPVRAVNDALPALRDQIEETVTMAIWGETGPVVIAMEETGQQVTINVRIGSVLPVAASAIGRTFAAFLPEFVTRETIASERTKAEETGQELPSEAEFAVILDDVRMRRMSRVRGAVMPGLDALAAPVFDHSGKLIAVVCTFGRAGAFDSRWNGRCARILAEVTEGLSRQFGFVEAIPER